MKLEEIKALIEAATPGPWAPHTEVFKRMCDAVSSFEAAHARGVTPNLTYVWHKSANGDRDKFVSITGNGPCSEANAALIAASRTVLPLLVKVAEAAKGVLPILEQLQRKDIRIEWHDDLWNGPGYGEDSLEEIRGALRELEEPAAEEKE